jgi:hypothetical protein
MIARPRIAARRLAEHRRSRTATHRTDSGNERQQWNARSGSTPPVSKIAGLRRGQSAAEELAVPDSYFARADRGRAFSIFEKQSVGPRLFVDAILEDRPLRPNFDDGHAVQCVEAALRTANLHGFHPRGRTQRASKTS